MGPQWKELLITSIINGMYVVYVGAGTQPIRVSAPNSTTPMSVLPGTGGTGSGSGAGTAITLSAFVMASCLAVSLLATLL